MADDRKPPPRFRRPSDLKDDEVVEIPPETERSFPRVRLDLRGGEPFNKLVQTPAETTREVLAIQRKMALQLDGFGQAMNRRFDLFHEELALQRADTAAVRAIIESDHGPRLSKVEATTAQKVAKGGGIVGIVLLAAPMLADALPKYRGLFEAIAGAFQ
jgi:hypothetical protein